MKVIRGKRNENCKFAGIIDKSNAGAEYNEALKLSLHGMNLLPLI